MPRVSVRLPGVLRPHAADRAVLDVDATDVGALLETIALHYPGVARRVRDEQGQLRRHVNVFVGEHNVRDLDGLATPLRDGDSVAILPSVSGG
jgi:molybdopterin synthase sulfur carrier subunit